MKNSARIFITLSIFLILGAAIMGCSSSSGSNAVNNTSANTPSATVTTTATGPQFIAGDIVSSSSSSSTGWLVISYDSAKDSYTRAFIYKNTDGTWGYRISSSTETAARNVMEKVYKVKITHVTVSSIPTSAPTVVTATVTTKTATVAKTTATTTVTTTTAGKPSFKSMIPDEGNAGSSVSITDLVGNNFQSGATVQLTHSGSTSINATSVVRVSASHMTCTFAIPSNAVAGAWNIVITNPDGQTATYSSYFTVHGSTSSVTTTTTTSASSGSIVITSVTPTSVTGSNYGWTGRLTIDTSTTLQQGLTVTLTNSAGTIITVENPQLNSNTEIYPLFTSVPKGIWTVKVTNPDGSYGVYTGGLVVN